MPKHDHLIGPIPDPAGKQPGPVPGGSSTATATGRFDELGVSADLISTLERRGITSPFPIQAATLPDALAGRDICGKAPTGSGKTLAFGLTLATRTQRAKPKRPTALVLVPTRELAAQVEREIAPLAAARKLRVATVYGGVGYGPQRSALRRGTEILVACPGRLEDLIEQRDLVLDDVSIAVIDEADRMADMGFLPAVRRLLDRTRSDRQTLLFSATLDGDVDVLVKRYQSNPATHATAPEIEGDVSHHFWRTERGDRLQVTASLVARHYSSLVFCRTRHGADRLAKQLGRTGVKAAAIHGSRSQPQRERALKAFSNGGVSVLVATDVAARGIHVDDVSCVVHFDPPTTHKDYVHRSGRTGRAGANGMVVSLVSREQERDAKALQKALRMPHNFERPDLGGQPLRERPQNGERSQAQNGERRRSQNGDRHQPRSQTKGGARGRQRNRRRTQARSAR